MYTVNQMHEFARQMGILVGKTYLLEEQEVVPFAEDDELHTLAALEHGFIHYKFLDGTVNYAGIHWFAKNAHLMEIQ